mmetsp:Transcript_44556/g.139724  ORF Transcript_44556/g.139724 Transcript_44556/m.139724 type:complete len:305 (+) Transcript_44556:112-1026(+)
MGIAPDEAEADAVQDEGEEEADAGDGEAAPSFRDLLGPDCIIKRVDKDQNVLSAAKPEEMERELMTRAAAQKRIGACAEHVKDMSRAEKLRWALHLKDQANEFYSSSNFDEASKLYNDCLVALDLEGSEEENAEVATKLQLPVCTNLAACMIETGHYPRCIELCDIALGVDPRCAKALYRRGLAHYRLGEHRRAVPDLEAALACVREQRAASGAGSRADAGGLDDLERRVVVYLGHIRRYSAAERARCQKMFDKALYRDRPGAGDARPTAVDDSDEAIEAALARRRGSCCPCRCSRRAEKEKTS